MATNTPQDAFDILQCGRKNLVINGDMQIWQRGTSVNVGIDQFVRCVDRFWIYCPSGSGNFQRSTDAPTGFIYSLHNNSTAIGSIGTNVELAVQGSSYPFTLGEWITVSFYVKSTSYNTSTVSFSYRDTAEGSGNVSIGASFNRSFYYTTEWRKVSISIQIDALPSGNNRMLQFEFGLPAGAKVTGLQLEKGKVATPFEYRSYGQELALCQRYFLKQNNPITSSCLYAAGAFSAGGHISVPYPVIMRVTPTAVTISYINDDNTASLAISTLNNSLTTHAIRYVFTVISGGYPYCSFTTQSSISAEL
jgi:hypothetical protein